MSNGISKTPNPGSDEAVAGGCNCPVEGNLRGTRPPWPASPEHPKGAWYVRVDCPMHGSSYGVEENQTPSQAQRTTRGIWGTQ